MLPQRSGSAGWDGGASSIVSGQQQASAAICCKGYCCPDEVLQHCDCQHLIHATILAICFGDSYLFGLIKPMMLSLTQQTTAANLLPQLLLCS